MAVTLRQVSERGMAVLLLPSFGADWRVWGEFGSLLAARFSVTTIEWPGHGGTPPPSGPVDLIAETLSAIKSTVRYAAVVAAGTACGAAVRLGLEHRAAAVVLLEPQFDEPLEEADIDYQDALDLRFAQFHTVSDAVQAALAMEDPGRRREALADALITHFADRLDADDRSRIRAMLTDLAELALNVTTLSAEDSPWVRLIRDVSVPVLVAGQGGDEYVRESRRALAARAPDGHLAILDSDIEYSWLSHSRHAAQIISDFITEAHTNAPDTRDEPPPRPQPG